MNLVAALRLMEAGQSLAGQSPPVISLTGGGGKTSTMYRLAAELKARDIRVVCTSTTRLAAYEVETTEGVVEVVGSKLPYDDVGRALDRYNLCLLVTPEIVESGLKKYPGIECSMVDKLVSRSAPLGLGAVIVEADGAKMLPLKAPDEHEPPLPASTTILAPFAGMDALGRRIGKTWVHRSEKVRELLGLSLDTDERVTPARVADLLMHPQGGRKGCPPGARFLPILNKTELMPEMAGARIAAQLMAESGVSSLVASTGRIERDPVHERWGPTAAVVLAAGESRRFGTPKQLVEVDGEPLVVRAVKTALESGVNEVIVVTGAYADETVNCLVERLEEELKRIRIVHNDAWYTGQASSMHAALHALPQEMQAALFLPVDQPFVSVSLLRRMVQLWRKGWGIAAAKVDGQIRGAPGLFDREYWPELLQVCGDIGGRDLLRKYGSQVGSVDVDGRTLVDVDTPSDLKHIR